MRGKGTIEAEKGRPVDLVSANPCRIDAVSPPVLLFPRSNPAELNHLPAMCCVECCTSLVQPGLCIPSLARDAVAISTLQSGSSFNACPRCLGPMMPLTAVPALNNGS